MATAFAELAFTPSVKAAQRYYGSREKNSRFELAENARNRLTEAEADFIGKEIIQGLIEGEFRNFQRQLVKRFHFFGVSSFFLFGPIMFDDFPAEARIRGF